ncbi:MAG: hypothetical protein Fur0043_26810 [Anaerolineales bacterium]
MLSPEEGADTTLYLSTDPAVDGVSGEYFIKRKPVSPAPQALETYRRVLDDLLTGRDPIR